MDSETEKMTTLSGVSSPIARLNVEMAPPKLIHMCTQKPSKYDTKMPITDFDDQGQSKIARIFISYEGGYINLLQYQYVKNNTLNLSDMYGKAGTLTFKTVTLDYPMEYITSLSGYYCSYGVNLLSIGTNKGMHGPFGSANDSSLNYKHFEFEFGPESNFFGFCGSYNNSGCGSGRLTSIGAYLNPVVTHYGLNGVKKEKT